MFDLARKRIASRIYVSDRAIAPAGNSAAIFDAPEGSVPEVLYRGRRVLRVDITEAAKGYGENTALGKALSWLAQVLREGETVTVCGPNALTIVRLHLQRSGFSDDEADHIIGEDSPFVSSGVLTHRGSGQVMARPRPGSFHESRH